MKSAVILLAVLTLSFQVFAEDKDSDVTLDFPVIDAPYNFTVKGYLAPSMRQSLAVSTDFYESIHRGIEGTEGSARWRKWMVIPADIISFYFPLGTGWMHEEWHRAVMGRRGIASYNDINDFPIGRSLIAVSHETDEDMIRLKKGSSLRTSALKCGRHGIPNFAEPTVRRTSLLSRYEDL